MTDAECESILKCKHDPEYWYNTCKICHEEAVQRAEKRVQEKAIRRTISMFLGDPKDTNIRKEFEDVIVKIVTKDIRKEAEE